MKTAKAITRTFNNITDNFLLIISLILILVGSYALYDSYMVYRSVLDDTILKFKPGYDLDENLDKTLTDDYVAWLTVDDTNIDHPIMQGEDNNEYLNKDPYGDYSLAGSIFLDSRNSPDFLDEYSLIYGHHMEQGVMFGALDHFLKEKYFRKHKTGSLVVGDTVYPLRIFAVVGCDATEDAVFNPTEFDELTLPYIIENHIFIDEDGLPEEGEKLLGLSTCKYPNSAERTIVFAVIEAEHGTKLEETIDD